MNPTRAISLVAARDFAERIRSRAFQLSTGFTLLLVIAFLVVPTFFDDDAQPYRVAIDTRLPDDIELTLGALDPQGIGFDFSRVSSDIAGIGVENGDFDGALIAGPEVVVGDGTPGTLRSLLVAAATTSVIAERAEDLGLDPTTLTELLTPPEVPISDLTPVEDDDRESNQGFAAILAIVMFMVIVTYGQWILIGVVEEKSNRVVEMVLGAIRPHRLLVGKIIGIGALGLLQVVAIVGMAVIVAQFIDLPALPDAAVSTIVWSFVWFFLGFGFYATAYAAAGSLVSRQEEAQNAAFPLTILLLAAFYTALFSVGSDNPVLRVASFLPPFAPITMPLRIAGGDAAVWEIGVSFTVMVVSTYLLVRFAGRVYSGGLLRTGGKVKLSEAWRSAEA
ncbi:MAG: ABC transporter permease [Acidimicrobiia bacterium]|nr:ABC transporter permease [Acidimicrobiia bacterium]